METPSATALMETYPKSGMYIQVRVLQVRANFGRKDYQVEPMTGRGAQWVVESRLRFDGATDAD